VEEVNRICPGATIGGMWMELIMSQRLRNKGIAEVAMRYIIIGIIRGFVKGMRDI
jgi:hypothetical protein